MLRRGFILIRRCALYRYRLAIFDYSVEDEIVKRIAEAGLGSKENLNTSS